jgi:hypothetical protein
MNNQPSITCLMPTCGRTVCIGESIFSFINQTYPNRKLIILDTHPQDMKFNIKFPDNIFYVKSDSKQYSNLGDKYRHLITMVDTELFCIWEDDDIWLPNHLESLVQTYNMAIIEPMKRYKIGHPKHFAMYGGVGKPITYLKLDGNCCWCRYLFENKQLDSVDLKEPCDISLLTSFDSIWSIQLPTYIYRWDNGQCHMSGLYGQKSYNDLYRMFEDLLSTVDISSKIIDVKWLHDYPALCKGI